MIQTETTIHCDGRAWFPDVIHLLGPDSCPDPMRVVTEGVVKARRDLKRQGWARKAHEEDGDIVHLDLCKSCADKVHDSLMPPKIEGIGRPKKVQNPDRGCARIIGNHCSVHDQPWVPNSGGCAHKPDWQD